MLWLIKYQNTECSVSNFTQILQLSKEKRCTEENPITVTIQNAELKKFSEPITCFEQDDTTVIRFSQGVYYISEPIRICGNNIRIEGMGQTFLRGCIPAVNPWKHSDGNIVAYPLIRRADRLFVGGKRYEMARYPKYDADNPILHGYASDALSLHVTSKWKHPEGAYIHALHARLWGGFSYEITGNTPEGITYTGGTQNNRQDGMHEQYRYVENIFEEMTLPTEWCYSLHDRCVYLIPNPTDDLKTAEFAINSCFFDVQDSSNITFSDIVFERSSRTFMQTKEPLQRSDWTIYRGGAVYFKDCVDCVTDRCVFREIGSNGVFVDGNCENIRIQRTHFQNIGASAVCFVGRSDSVRSSLFEYSERQNVHEIDKERGPKSENYPKNCIVDDCLIEHVGETEKQAAGVEISTAYGITVQNTSIYDVSRAGINISEGTFGGHCIDGCDIFDTVLETGDHGSFNSWGRDRFWELEGVAQNDLHQYANLDCIRPNVIRNSRFRCDHGWDIDLDDGSSFYEIYNNLCLHGGIKLREGFHRNVHHNVTINNSLHLHVWYPNSEDVIENNIVCTPYQPILMNNYGRKIDGNILHQSGLEQECHADILSEITGMDAHSVCMDCHLSFTEEGSVRLDLVRGFENFPKRFGVRYAPLRKKSKTPCLPKILQSVNGLRSIKAERFGIRVKDIRTDDEMSAYGTAGHNGVIVLSVGTENCKGLREGDVLVKVGAREIQNAEDFCLVSQKEWEQSELTVLRKQIYTVLK